MSGNAARVQAIHHITNRKPMTPKAPERLEAIWAEPVFDLKKMQVSLPTAVFKSIKNTILTGEKLDISGADSVATAMRDWATAKGAL
jgi:glutamine synthetase